MPILRTTEPKALSNMQIQCNNVESQLEEILSFSTASTKVMDESGSKINIIAMTQYLRAYHFARFFFLILTDDLYAPKFCRFKTFCCLDLNGIMIGQLENHTEIKIALRKKNSEQKIGQWILASIVYIISSHFTLLTHFHAKKRVVEIHYIFCNISCSSSFRGDYCMDKVYE